MGDFQQIDNHIDYIEFAVSNIEQSKRFYSLAFGWTFTDYGPLYCEFTDGRIKGGFEVSSLISTGGPLIVLYHQNLEGCMNAVIKAGGKITKEIFQFPGGERFQFKDLDGYELAVWRVV